MMKILIISIFMLIGLLSPAQAKKPPFGMTKNQAMTLSDFMESTYSEINQYLRNHTEEDEHIEEHIEVVTEAIKKLPRYAKRTFRGICFENQEIAGLYLKKGTIVQDPGYTSASKNKSVALDYLIDGTDCTPVLMKIKSKNGIDIEAFARSSVNPSVKLLIDEEEVLYDRNTQFRVVKVNLNAKKWYGKFHYIVLKEI